MRQDSLWCQGSTTAETSTNSAGDRCEYARMLWSFYRDRYNSIFADTPLPEELDPAHPNAARFPATCKPNATTPGAWEMMPAADRTAINRIMSNQGKAIAAYEAKLISRNAPFDRFVAGETDAIPEEAKRGLKLFVGKASCVDCHKGSFFTDLTAHNLGVPQEGMNVPAQDLGFFAGIPQLKSNSFTGTGAYSDNVEAGTARNAWLRDPVEDDKGRFRTPTLRNISQTAPYMHTGGLPTLRSVVQYYNKGGGDSGFVGTKDVKLKPLLLSEREIDELVAFLNTLTGEDIPAELRANPHSAP
jgi:cytochrome c peroxidase